MSNLLHCKATVSKTAGKTKRPLEYRCRRYAMMCGYCTQHWKLLPAFKQEQLRREYGIEG